MIGPSPILLMVQQTWAQDQMVQSSQSQDGTTTTRWNTYNLSWQQCTATQSLNLTQPTWMEFMLGPVAGGVGVMMGRRWFTAMGSTPMTILFTIVTLRESWSCGTLWKLTLNKLKLNNYTHMFCRFVISSMSAASVNIIQSSLRY